MSAAIKSIGREATAHAVILRRSHRVHSAMTGRYLRRHDGREGDNGGENHERELHFETRCYEFGDA
ncbi:MAG: hypothetical protein NTV56_03085 [Alphaproteobacteria bacterium]|nr:hypothetical protein [Alphaproteobacteria bacterium]